MTTSPAARTATFLLTDIEGSTRLWDEQRAAMSVALEAHDVLLRAAVEQAGGTVVKTTGDGVLAAFDLVMSIADGSLRDVPDIAERLRSWVVDVVGPD